MAESRPRASFGLDHTAQFPLFDCCHSASATFGPWVEIAGRYVQHTKERPKSVGCSQHFQLHAPRTSPNNHNRIETHTCIRIILDAHSGINNSICAPRDGESEEYQPSTHSV
jgi:hypothetical protein